MSYIARTPITIVLDFRCRNRSVARILMMSFVIHGPIATFESNDFDFDSRNAKFAMHVRNVFRAAGKSQAWTRLAPFVRHLCLTVTNKSLLKSGT